MILWLACFSVSAQMQIAVGRGGIPWESICDSSSFVQIKPDSIWIWPVMKEGNLIPGARVRGGGVYVFAPRPLEVNEDEFVDMSTIHPLETDQIRQGLRAQSISMVDAPVGRTSVEAEKGESLFMVGAEECDFKIVQPILACMGDTFIDCGGPGTGSRMKIVNNLMTTSLNVLTAQVLTFSEATGLDQNVALEVMGGTAAGRGHMSTTYPSKVLRGDLEPAFMIDLAKKDLDIAIKFSETLGVPISLAIQAEKIYTDAQADGRGRQDWTAIFDMLQKKQHSKS